MVEKAINTFLPRALADGHAKLIGEGKQQRILYVAVNHSERFSDPEEKVRAEFWAELIYRLGYEPQRIGVEITVPDRTPKDTADLVVFHDDERKRPYSVIECKQEGITDAEFAQAVEQSFGNGNWAKFRAAYVGVVAGRTRQFFDCSDKFGSLEREKNIIADLPQQYGKPLEYKFYKGGIRFEDAARKKQVEAPDIQSVSKEDLIAAIRKCHQTLWGGGKLSPPMAFGELCKIIFVKIRDEQAPRKTGEPYEFQIRTNEASLALATRIRDLYAIEQRREPGVFNDTIRVEDAVLRTVVSHLESINLNKTDLDTKGVAFEQFMDGFFKGDFGQYFTPRELISFAISMLPPSRDDLVLDPACGSGGFLLYAMDHIRKEASQYYTPGTAEHFRHWHEFAQQHLFGIEINDEIARVAKMNMIIHDDGHTNVIGHDALEGLPKIAEHHRSFAAAKFNLVLTNPPFGAMVKQTEKPYLSDFELSRYAGKPPASQKAHPDKMEHDAAAGKRALKQRTSVKTEILFCERVWQFLQPGAGRAAIVLPDGILTNSSLQPVRDWIIQHFQIFAVVSLPEEAFSHFGTGVKASLLFLRKRALDESPSASEIIFMAAPTMVGYDSTGRKCENQLPQIAEQFHIFHKQPKAYKPDAVKLPASLESATDKLVFDTLKLGGTEEHQTLITTVALDDLDDALNPARYVNRFREKLFSGRKISDVCDVLTRKVNPKKLGPDDLWDLVRIDDLAANPVEIATVRTVKGSELKGSFFEIEDGDILYARLGPTIINRKIVIFSGKKRTTLASPEFLVLRRKAGTNTLALYALLRCLSYRDLAYSKTRGATPSRYRLSRLDLLKLPVPPMSDDAQKVLADEIESRRDKVRDILKQAEELWS